MDRMTDTCENITLEIPQRAHILKFKYCSKVHNAHDGITVYFCTPVFDLNVGNYCVMLVFETDNVMHFTHLVKQASVDGGS